MKFNVLRLVVLGLAVVSIVAFSGCPARPALTVQPAAITLSDIKLTAQIRITNDGGGTLDWEMESNAPWLVLSTQSQTEPTAAVSAETRSIDIVTVHFKKDLLPDDEVLPRAVIAISSNGGDLDVPVAIERVRTPVLAVEPASIAFEATSAEQSLEILNYGDALLLWDIQIPEDIAWLTATPLSGSLARASADLVTLKVNRAMMAPAAEPYQVALTVRSNGGDISVDVSVVVSPFSVSIQTIDFGVTRQSETQVIDLSSQTDVPVALDISLDLEVGDAWLTVDRDSVEITRDTPYSLRLTANPDGLDAGEYTATLVISHPDTGRSAVIPVAMRVTAPPQFRIEPETVDFGETREPVQREVTITNEGDTPLEWRVEKSEDAQWVTVSEEEGVVSDSVTLTLNAIPTLLQPADYRALITFYVADIARVVPATLSRLADPIPDAIQVELRELEFGALLSVDEFYVWNEGPSALAWYIDEADVPDWLSITPLSGTVTGADTETVRVEIDRDLAPDEDVFAHTLLLRPETLEIDPVEIRITAQQPRFPEIVLIGEDIASDGIPLIVIDIGQDSEIFVIRNEGNANLDWRIDMEDTPAWITAVSREQDQLRPGREQQVSVTANRAGLSQSGATHRFMIHSNDPNRPIAPIDVHVRVPFSITIGARPRALDFGRDLSALSLWVANTGDAGQFLDFVVTTNRPDWLFVEPNRGRSIGTPGVVGVDGEIIRDWQLVSVAIDRSRITGQGAAAKLIIEAENVPANAAPVVPLEIPVTVDIAELTVEGAFPRLRPPSLLRFNLLMRDARQQVFPGLEDDDTDEYSLFQLNTVAVDILEDSLPLELSETNVFIKKNEALSFAVLIMLDFSKSMFETAQELVRDGQLEPLGADPLEFLYIEAIGAMIEAFPDHYQVGLAVFNERRPWLQGDLRPITGAPAGYSLRANYDVFTSDKAIVRHRLENMDVRDYGATPLLPAVVEGALHLYNIDATLPDFDSVAERLLLAVTDGRRTTPPGDLNAVIDLLDAARVRFMGVGFGKNVIANSLIQLSVESGGHYYGTESKIETGVAGEQVFIPLVGSLMELCGVNMDDPDVQSIPRDLRSHIVLSYATLNEESGTDVQTRIEVEEVDPSVRDTFTAEAAPMFSIANDVRLGQIGMRTQGIQGDTAVVRFYSDYMPRGITQMRFSITASPASDWSVSPVARPDGGLLSTWNFTDLGNELIMTAPESRAIAYAEYGNLFDIVLTGLTGPVTLNTGLLEPVISGHPDSKYFTMPASITVDAQPFVATSFPNPAFAFDPGFVSEISSTIDLGTDWREVSVHITNTGGSHLPTDADLYWIVRPSGDPLPGTLPAALDVVYFRDDELVDEEDGLYLIHVADNAALEVLVPEDAPSGEIYSAGFFIDVDYGSLFLEYQHGPYYVKYQVP